MDIWYINYRIRLLGNLLLVLFSIFPFFLEASLSKSYDLTFVAENFSFIRNDCGEIEIETESNVVYPDLNEPGLPLISVDIVIDSKYEYHSSSINYDKRIIMRDEVIAASPIPISTNGGFQVNAKRTYDSNAHYPSSSCKYVTTSNYGSIKVLHFLISPFSYEAKNRILYFIDSIELNIELNESKYSEKHNRINNLNAALLRSFVINRDYVNGSTVMQTGSNLNESNNRLDYIIITNEKLKNSFKPLIDWKIEKGLYSKIITIEDIKQNYSGSDDQHKIKNCLHDLYQTRGLKYVLLGGDDGIVPVRGCYSTVNSDRGLAIDKTIPTDMYYACFGGNFEWNANGNDLYGEIADSIDFSQSICVTRVPVYTVDDVECFINKLLIYEQSPTFNNNILMCGINSFDSGTAKKSDGEMQGDKLYQKWLQPYWNGTRIKFYDTYTDFPDGMQYDLTPENLEEQLNEGYSFMNFITHGSQTAWTMESLNEYNISYGNRQRNKGSTLITTIACYTNAFDSSERGAADPCLSESLIRNSNSGVVAYLGCSRQGWGYSGSNLGPSLLFEGKFYKNLFSDDFENKSFGAIVASVKASNVASCYGYNATRWLQLGINPIGDPEMPVWTSKPEVFDNLSVLSKDSCISIDAGVEECRICIMDECDHGEYYYKVYDNVRKVSMSDLPEESSVCITKQGYLPQKLKMRLLQNKKVSKNSAFYQDAIILGSSVTSDKKEGPVVIETGKTTIKSNYVSIMPGTKVLKGAQLQIKTF